MSVLKRWNGTSWEPLTQITSPEIAELKNNLKTELPILNWELNHIDPNSGGNYNSNKYIRTSAIKNSQHYFITCEPGYTFVIHIYDNNDVHKGMYDGNTIQEPRSTSYFLQGNVELSIQDGWYLKISMKDIEDTAQDDTSISENLKVYIYTDATLTESGKAADAKVVGDKLAEAELAINALEGLNTSMTNAETAINTLESSVTSDEATIDMLKELNSYLIYKRSTAKSGTTGGVIYSIGTDGSITLNGTATSPGIVSISGSTSAIPSWVQSNTNYYLDIGGVKFPPKAYLTLNAYKTNTSVEPSEVYTAKTFFTHYAGPDPLVFHIDDISNFEGIRLRIYINRGATFSNFTFTPRILSSPPNSELYQLLNDKWTWDNTNKLRVMQYNIGGYKFGYKTTQVEEHKLTEPMYQRKLAGLKKLFADYKPDVVGIQEQEPYMDKAQTHKSIDELFAPDFTFLQSNTSYEVGLFAKRSMTPIVSPKQEDSNRTAGFQTMHGTDDRHAIWYLAETDVGGRKVAIATGAFGYVSADSDASINNCITELQQVIDALEDYDYAIIMGDFNRSLRYDGGKIIDPDNSLNGAETTSYVALMTDTSKKYIYCGRETGYQHGHLYNYENGTWTDKGEANSSSGYYVSGDEYIEDYQISDNLIGIGYTGYNNEQPNSMETVIQYAKNHGYTACQGLTTGWIPKPSYVHHHKLAEKFNVSPYLTDTSIPEVGYNPRTYSCLDNIMVKGEIAIANFEVLSDRYEQLCSDHIPVIADLYFYGEIQEEEEIEVEES